MGCGNRSRLITQICDAEDIRILKGAVSQDHVHTYIQNPPSNPELQKRYWGTGDRLWRLTHRQHHEGMGGRGLLSS
ncbi:MAG: transposase [Oscillatoriophycideae cyanobacterium NC_groundwater_1537_Pr4_S-0.65um_50_18]|nr:transposase [Oscillatoriophycideae cyanobacterium NC_groundwater_1537_Pr4_S-0.65um_50_18]